MATRSLGQLTLDLVARIGGFTGPLEQAQRSAKKQMTSIAGSVKTATTAVTAAGAAATAAAAGVLAFTNRAAENARELQNQASVANASVEEFQRLSYASSNVGVEQGKLSDILKDVNDRVGDFMATGGGPMADFFEQIAPKIGVTAEEFRNLSGPQALQLYYDSLEKANLSQADMTFYLEAMASDTTALIPLLRDGGAEFARMAEEADKLGIVLTELDIAKLNEFAGQFDRLTSIMESMGNILAAELAPYLSVIGDYIVEAAEGADGLREALPGAIHDSVAALGPLLDKFRELQILDQQVKVGTAQMNLAFAEFAQGAWESMEWFLNTALAGINNLIRGINAIPGMDDIELLGSFSESEFMGRIIQQTDDARQSLWEYSWELHDLVNRPLPSESIDAYLEDVQAKIAEFQQKLNEEGGILGPGGGMPGSAGESAGAGDESSAGSMGGLGLYSGADTGDAVMPYWEQWLEGAEEALTSFDELAGNVVENFSQGFGNAFESMIFDAESLNDAMAGLAEGMARSIVNALGEMAAQWLAYQAVQMLVGKTTQASAATTMTANAMASQQMAGLNAFASTAAIPIVGPIMAPAAMAAALAATTPAVAAVSSMAMAGMAHDGIDSVPTEGTWLLDKGERVMNRPQADKLDRFLAQQEGGGSAGAAPTINIIEDQSRAGTTSQRRDQDGAWVIDVVVASISGDGKVDKAMRGKYGLKPQGR